MNLHRIALVAVALSVASLSTLGCKRSSTEDATNDTEANAEDTGDPAVTSPGVTQGEDGENAEHPAPPEERLETPGTAPAATHTWQRGYWRWDIGRRQYLWVPGFWLDPDAVPTSAPPALRVETPGVAPGRSYAYAPGFWRWSGRSWIWRYGYWSIRRPGYVAPRWEHVGGRWVFRPEHRGEIVRRGEGRHGDGHRGEGRHGDGHHEGRHDGDRHGGDTTRHGDGSHHDAKDQGGHGTKDQSKPAPVSPSPKPTTATPASKGGKH
jgi:hypothetical protein